MTSFELNVDVIKGNISTLAGINPLTFYEKGRGSAWNTDGGIFMMIDDDIFAFEKPTLMDLTNVFNLLKNASKISYIRIFEEGKAIVSRPYKTSVDIDIQFDNKIVEEIKYYQELCTHIIKNGTIITDGQKKKATKITVDSSDIREVFNVSGVSRSIGSIELSKDGMRLQSDSGATVLYDKIKVDTPIQILMPPSSTSCLLAGLTQPQVDWIIIHDFGILSLSGDTTLLVPSMNKPS